MERYKKASQYVTQKMERNYPSLKGCRITITPTRTRLGNPYLRTELFKEGYEADVETRFTLLSYVNEAILRLKYEV